MDYTSQEKIAVLENKVKKLTLEIASLHTADLIVAQLVLAIVEGEKDEAREQLDRLSERTRAFDSYWFLEGELDEK